jgi:hypothetical protein
VTDLDTLRATLSTTEARLAKALEVLRDYHENTHTAECVDFTCICGMVQIADRAAAVLNKPDTAALLARVEAEREVVEAAVEWGKEPAESYDTPNTRLATALRALAAVEAQGQEKL